MSEDADEVVVVGDTAGAELGDGDKDAVTECRKEECGTLQWSEAAVMC